MTGRTLRQIEAHRKGDAVVQVRDSCGKPCQASVWVEQETHAFRFGCVIGDPSGLSEASRQRYRSRLTELFNHHRRVGEPAEPGVLSVSVPEGCRLGSFRVRLDRLAASGQPLEIHVDGAAVGLIVSPEADERAAANRIAELYALCFAHPAVRGIIWSGLMDGDRADAEGLLRRDLSPRPAYRYLQKLIAVVWHSWASGETDAEGRFSFRGFFGDYRVAARVGDEAATVGQFCLRRGESGICHLVLAPPDRCWFRRSSR